MKKFVAIAFFVGCMIDAQAQKQDSIFIRQMENEILINSTAYENLRILTKKIVASLSG